jgi:glycosyltransferase involved in cell wall biosynthesis
MTVSVLLLTLNEEINISECLSSVSWSDDVVVLDSCSNDRTPDIARASNAKVIQRPFDDWSSHQNWAMSNIEFRHPWILYLDADERCSSALRDEILLKATQAAPFSAFRVRRKDFYLGRWLKHAQLYPTWLVRLIRPSRIRYERLVNPVAVVDGAIGSLDGHILHYPFSHGLSHWIARHNIYSDFEALEMAKTKDLGRLRITDSFSHDPNVRRRALKEAFYRLPARPIVKFIHYYLIRRGFLDGRAGFRYSALQAFYEYMISCKYDEIRKKRIGGKE